MRWLAFLLLTLLPAGPAFGTKYSCKDLDGTTKIIDVTTIGGDLGTDCTPVPETTGRPVYDDSKRPVETRPVAGGETTPAPRPGDHPRRAGPDVPASHGGFGNIGDYAKGISGLANEQAKAGEAAGSFQKFAAQEAARHREQAAALAEQKKQLGQRIANLGETPDTSPNGATAASRALTAGAPPGDGGPPPASGTAAGPGGEFGSAIAYGSSARGARGFASSSRSAYASAKGSGSSGGSSSPSGGGGRDLSSIRTSDDEGQDGSSRARGGGGGGRGTGGPAEADAKEKKEKEKDAPDTSGDAVVRALLAQEVLESANTGPSARFQELVAARAAMLKHGPGESGANGAGGVAESLLGAAGTESGAPAARAGDIAEPRQASLAAGAAGGASFWIPDMDSAGLFERVHAAHVRLAKSGAVKRK